MSPDLTYQEALFQQNLVWNASWAGVTEDICGIESLPFAPLHFVRLAAACSPFVCGGREPNMVDVSNFLWAVSPIYNPQSRWKKFRHWLRYYKAVRKLMLPELVSGIDEYLDEAWMDSPPKPDASKRHRSFYCPVVSLIRVLCPAYNMTPESVLNTPYKCLFQLAKPVLAQIADVPMTAPADAALWRERAKARKAAA
jgi:hypothetical protein